MALDIGKLSVGDLKISASISRRKKQKKKQPIPSLCVGIQSPYQPPGSITTSLGITNSSANEGTKEEIETFIIKKFKFCQIKRLSQHKIFLNIVQEDSIICYICTSQLKAKKQ